MKFSKYNQSKKYKTTSKNKESFTEWLNRKGYLSQWQELNELQKKALECEYKGW